MHLRIKVIARTKKPQIQFLSPDSYKVHVSAVREKGKANDALIELLAAYFRVPRSSVRIVKGATSSNKIVEVHR